ncbi:ROK family transcriptional regulator [Phyllobacterium salinisoli]|uniref:ROK family transcriptional regulator n=1 Tax=Phyllobacterium salinisoli TaxID=1899321 RepID=A0A368K6B1_9HYPH|nr:ROK family transcriptional regulator [Phyllobacterium salinisoli]RCS24928.1 ROK family transcriptional regulator [Phyllobacterium salinisoli]
MTADRGKEEKPAVGARTSGFKPEYAVEHSLAISRGSNQTGVRAYNERLVLSLVRRHGALPRADIARLTGLSAQTVSVIMRGLEEDGLLTRGERVRGRVGQPSTPMRLAAEGVFSFGLKIGRRSAELILMDFLGNIRMRLHETYRWPVPDAIRQFTLDGISRFNASLDAAQRRRIAGLGIAVPFELWNWVEEVGAPQADLDAWRQADLVREFAAHFPYPVFMQNDATAACGAELTFGRGPDFTDFVYFFIGSFIGGGVVLNNALYAGRTGNAGAVGSMPVPGPVPRPVRGSDPGGKDKPRQLIDAASVFVLERMLQERGDDTSGLWLSPENWDDFGAPVDEWIALTARNLAHATVAAASVIDFSAAIIDGWLPVSVRHRIVEATRLEIAGLDLQGISAPEIVEGKVGVHAKAVGAASLPLFNRYLFDQNVLFKDAV